MKLIDDAVRRILRKKFEMGLFDDPLNFVMRKEKKQQWNNLQNLKCRKDMAEKSIVLLKNENHLLPLNKHGKDNCIDWSIYKSNKR